MGQERSRSDDVNRSLLLLGANLRGERQPQCTEHSAQNLTHTPRLTACVTLTSQAESICGEYSLSPSQAGW